MVCVQSVVEEKNLLVQLKYGQKKLISASSLVFLSLKEEVDMNEPLSNYPEKEQGGLLTVVDDPEVG